MVWLGAGIRGFVNAAAVLVAVRQHGGCLASGGRHDAASPRVVLHRRESC
jgi:hypothetical protein